MSESFIPTLFDAFTREATSDIIGTGLGMPIVKKTSRYDGWYD